MADQAHDTKNCNGITDPYPACECFPTLGTDKGRRDKVGVMIALEVHVKELFLAEGLVAVTAGVRLLPRVSALVHDHVPLLKTQLPVRKASEHHRAATPAVMQAHHRPFIFKEWMITVYSQGGKSAPRNPAHPCWSAFLALSEDSFQDYSISSPSQVLALMPLGFLICFFPVMVSCSPG